MYQVTPKDVGLFRTDTLLVWVRRPDIDHQNWWLGFYSTDAAEAKRWDYIILKVCKELKFSPFHQGCWPIDHDKRHKGCKEWIDLYTCPGVAQVYEMWMGCSEEALAFPKDPLEELVAVGDTALKRLLAAVPLLQEKVAITF